MFPSCEECELGLPLIPGSVPCQAGHGGLEHPEVMEGSLALDGL